MNPTIQSAAMTALLSSAKDALRHMCRSADCEGVDALDEAITDAEKALAARPVTPAPEDIFDAVMDPDGVCPTCYQRLHVEHAPEPFVEAAIRWIRNNYQDHNIASLCDGLRALAAPSTPAAATPVRSSDAEVSRYWELLYAVERKHHGETRHQTALRYILQAELGAGEKSAATQGAPSTPALPRDEIDAWLTRRIKAAGFQGITDWHAFGEEIIRWTEAKHGVAATQAQASGWQPIETAPKDGTRFLAVAGQQIRLVRWADYGGDRFPIGDTPGDMWNTPPTHWMPLPDAPGTDHAIPASGYCSLGVGCDESGVCYADAHGEPSRCGRAPSTPAAALTDDEIDQIWAAASEDHDDGVNIHELARAVERHHGIGVAA